MVVNTTWGDPSAAVGSGGLDQATDNVIDETYLDRIASDLYRLGGTDGNAKTGKYQIGPTTAYSNASNTAGLTVNQDTADDEILSLKSNDVGHGITGITETGTFAFAKKYQAVNGGLDLMGLSAGAVGLRLYGAHATDDTNKTTSAYGAVILDGGLKNGTGVTALGGNANILAVRTADTTRFILDGDGDSHQDVGTAWTNFDSEDDIALLHTLSAHLTRADDPLRVGFAGWLERSREPLERLRLVTFNADGHHFVNWSRLHMLQVGALRQMAQRLTALERRALPA